MLEDSNQHHPMATDEEARAEARSAIEWLKHDSRVASFPTDPTGKDAQCERLRRKVGAPVGWRTRVIDGRALPGKRCQIVLLFSNDHANDPFRLALAESVDCGGLQIVAEQESGRCGVSRIVNECSSECPRLASLNNSLAIPGIASGRRCTDRRHRLRGGYMLLPGAHAVRSGFFPFAAIGHLPNSISAQKYRGGDFL